MIFRLLLLPKTALDFVLKIMEPCELLWFSLLTKKTEAIMDSVDLKPMLIGVLVTTGMHFMLRSTILTEQYAKEDLEAIGAKNSETKKAKEVAHAFSLSRRFAAKGVCFGENTKETYWVLDDHIHRKILNVCFCIARKLLTYCIPPADWRKKVAIQNWDLLHSEKWKLDTEWKLDLDDLLMANSMTFGVHSLSSKDLNRFLKLWRRNKSNPRLEYFFISAREPFDMDIVFHGIEYQRIVKDEIRTYRPSREGVARWDMAKMKNSVNVKGGYDFYRKNGTRATIIINARRTLVECFIRQNV